ncbi:energy-coupling factor transporter ATPase [Pediococcus stilesii]|uniref:ABC-type cobalt transport system, ATPase component n=1 Tax=Pediococcus stilesii TaxID=331679 RepID=A0A0R2KZN3_9LACO|nr:energy-coupling factor transporter ATPase [Pediococcus stilesii]KRN94817.1 ABC-type cobalt transport system, ATPase component [Pediococcus stilesii]
MDNIINVKNLTYKYANGGEKKALDNVSLSIKRGTWTSIVGHNGSGKSTLARSIDGLMTFSDGAITVDGITLSDDTVWDIRKRIGMIFQNPDNQFVGATVEDDVAFGLENLGVETAQMHSIVADVLEKVRMTDFKERQPDQLSGGQKQRVAIAGVLASKPKIIILDEATSMLDPQGRHEIIELINEIHRENNLTVLSITHDVSEAMLSDHVVVINDGKVVETGAPKDVFKDNEMLKITGLEQPFSAQLFDDLKQKGVFLPEELKMNEKGLEEWLWQSLLKA